MDVNLSKAVRSNLLSLQNTATMMGKTQERLATGLKVNSALDNPTNFFTASSLKSRAGDLGQLMDSVSNAVQTIQAADKGISAMTKLVESAQATARQALQTSLTVAETSVATGGTLNAGAFTAVDVSDAGDPGTAASLGSTSFAAVDLSAAPTAGEIAGTGFSAVDVSTGSVAFDLDVDGAGATPITIDAAAVTQYNTDNGTTLDASALSSDDMALLINDQFGSDVADGSSGEIVITSTAPGGSSSVAITNYASTANAGDAGLADGSNTGTAGDSISFDISINGGAAQSVTIDAAAVTAYNTANSTSLDASALSADDVALLINDQVGSDVATVDGGELALSASQDGTDPTIAISNFAETSTGGTSGLADGTDTGVAGVAGDAISFDLAVDGGTATTITIDAAAVTAYNSANSTSLDASDLSADDMALLINDQAGADVATVGTDGNLVLGSTTTGTDSDITVSNFASATTAGSSGIADGTDAGGAAGETTNVTNPKRAELVDQYNELLSQIDDLAKDASFNGVNLLNGDDLQVIFNEDGSSKLDITGVTFNSAGLGLSELAADDFDTNDGINAVLTDLKSGIEDLRTQASKFGSNLSVVETRQNFTKDMVNVLETGAANLTLADTNEEAANLLALQTRQQLSSTALSMASQSDQAVLRLF